MGDEIGLFMDVARTMLLTALKLAAPLLLIALVIGLLAGFFQALTQMHDLTLAFAPKLLGVFVAVLALAPWWLAVLREYTEEVIRSAPTWFP